jgi:carbonic anhydrase/acetyltransferase-like protein (isoleucine patch superfamily)
VGSNVLIGVNAAVLEDAHIGNYCLVGAGAVVLSGARIPDHSLVIGVPARVLALTEEQEQRLRDPTANYVRNARRYIDAGLGLQIPRVWPGT